MLRRTAALCLPAAVAVAAIGYGGAATPARAAVLALIAAGLLAAAMAAPRLARRPALAWLPLLFAVPVLQPLLMAAPLGWGHPWAAPDRALLDVPATCWALDREACLRAAAWAAGAAGATLLAAWAWRGERLVRLAIIVTALATAHAGTALLLSLAAPDWPSPAYGGRVRGTFVYPNHAAAFWGACLPMALLLASAQRGRRRLWLTAAVILATALVLSASRGGIIVACLASGPAAWAALPRRRRWAWAAAVAAVAAAWLWTANVEAVGERFGRLAGAQGGTLNGRALIWSSAASVLPEAGALGVGPGAAAAAFRRGGEDAFGATPVAHLHSDPLEWLLERGWLGAALGLCGAAAAAALAWRARRRAPTADPLRRAVAVGAALGLAHLCLHGLGDFVWQREAIVLLACCWIAIAMDAGVDETALPPRPTAGMRAALACAALLVGWACLAEAPRGAAEGLAWDARRDVRARVATGLPPRDADTAQRVLAGPHATVQAATLAAELRLARPPAGGDEDAALRAAAADLEAAARLAPADPDAWILRLRLAVRRGDAAQATAAAGRVLALTPGRPEARRALLEAALGPAAAGLPPEIVRQVMLRTLQDSWSPPAAFWPAAERLLGAPALASGLLTADPRVLRAGERWLSMHAPLEDWLAARSRLAPASGRCPPERLLAAAAAWPAAPRPEVPADPEQARLLAMRLLAMRLGQPEALRAALAAAGLPMAVLAGAQAWPGDDASSWLAERAGAADRLAPWQHVPWARGWWDESRLAAAIADGRTAGVRAGHAPALIAAAWSAASDGAERARLELALRACDRGWSALGGCHARWWWQGSRAPTVRSPGWVGVVVDGAWAGWRRGAFTVSAEGPGLHRLVVMPAP